MTSAVSIHDLDLLYIKKTPSKGTRSRDSTQFHRPFTGQSQRHRSVPLAVSGRPAEPTFFNPAAQKCTSPSYPYPLPLSGLAFPFSERYSFHHRLLLKNMSPGRFGPGHGGYRPFRSCSYSSAQGLKVSANRVPVPVLPEPGETCLIPVSLSPYFL